MAVGKLDLTPIRTQQTTRSFLNDNQVSAKLKMQAILLHECDNMEVAIPDNKVA